MSKKLDELRDQIGEISVTALRVGGDELFHRATSALGVALRHSERLDKGQLQETDCVVAEIEDSIDRARAVVAAAQTKQAELPAEARYEEKAKTMITLPVFVNGQLYGTTRLPYRIMEELGGLNRVMRYMDDGGVVESTDGMVGITGDAEGLQVVSLRPVRQGKFIIGLSAESIEDARKAGVEPARSHYEFFPFGDVNAFNAELVSKTKGAG